MILVHSKMKLSMKIFNLARNADILSGEIKTYLKDLSLGLTYYVSPDFLIHLGIEAGTSQGEEATFLDLFGKVHLGIDYTF